MKNNNVVFYDDKGKVSKIIYEARHQRFVLQ